MSALDPIFFEAQIAASDVNADGLPLTVGDLAYLLRIIVGDALPFPMLLPFGDTASFSVVNGRFASQSVSEIGAVYATFTVNGAYSVVNHSTMEIVSADGNGELRVLVYSGLTNMANRIAIGTNTLFTVTGDVKIIQVEAADYNGNLMTSKTISNVLPRTFELLQNYPNPFNASTKIGLNLPTETDWTIDIISVSGQRVESFRGHGFGNIQIEWDATNHVSGVYFYKATAGAFTDTKKMVLMK